MEEVIATRMPQNIRKEKHLKVCKLHRKHKPKEERPEHETSNQTITKKGVENLTVSSPRLLWNNLAFAIYSVAEDLIVSKTSSKNKHVAPTNIKVRVSRHILDFFE